MTVPEADKAAAASRLKVFLSYSRKDSALAGELLEGLELLGFDAYLDKQDIAPGEPWEERLGNLIRQADTVVFILSPNSIASKHCSWEVEETAKSGKRLVPVMHQAVPDAQVPELLRRLNYVFFNEGQSFSKSLGQLAHALRADAGWIREHSRFAELAARWQERGKTDALLLRGSDLEEAKKWAVSRPQNAPEISASQQAFLEASSRALSEELAAKVKLRWRVQMGLAAASLVLAGFAGLSFFLWRQADAANVTLEKQKARLERKLALRAAPRGYTAYDVPAGWFQIATNYAGAVAFVEKRSEPSRIMASGALINGRTLNEKWDDRPVFVTANYVVGNLGMAALPASGVQIVLLGPNNERRTAALEKTVWEAPELGISVSTIKDALPPDVTPITKLASGPVALSRLETYPWSRIDEMFDDAGMLKGTPALRPIVFVGNLEGRNEVAISISHLLGIASDRRGGFSNAIPKSTRQPCSTSQSADCDSDAVGSAARIEPNLVYTHGTLPGGGGSPIFDAESGELIGIHLASYQCPRMDLQTNRRCTASGTSITHLLAAIRKN